MSVKLSFENQQIYSVQNKNMTKALVMESSPHQGQDLNEKRKKKKD